MKFQHVGDRMNGIFIVGSGKSGTTLLQSLLDWHPHLLVFPVESMFYRDKVSHLLPKNIIKYILTESKFTWMQYDIYTQHVVEKSRDFSNVDYFQFKQVVKNYDTSLYSRKELYLTLVRAYRKAINKNKEEVKYFVDKTPTHLEKLSLIREDFPTAKMIHMLRDPLDTYLAYKTNMKRIAPSPTMLARKLRIIAKSFKIASENDNSAFYRIVRYEDIVVNTEEEMRKLADWLGIIFHPTLLTPSIAGKYWGGNSSTGCQFNGISKSRIGTGKKNLSRDEIDYIYSKLENIEKWYTG